MVSTRSYLGGDQRRKFGFVTTWENADGKTLTAHRAGRSVRELLRELAGEVASARDPSFRLVSYSTPDTIAADLDGARADYQGGLQKVRVASRVRRTTRKHLPEAIVLAGIGRSDLLHPRLLSRGRRDA